MFVFEDDHGEVIGFHRAMGAEAERTIEPVPGFVITVFWHGLTPNAAGERQCASGHLAAAAGRS